MFKTFVTPATLIGEEPMLLNYCENGDIELSEILQLANEHLINDLANRGIQLKRICTPLILTNGVEVEDKIERKRFVINVKNITSDVTVTLKGRNNSFENYTIIFNNIVLSGINEYNQLITNPYNYYLLELSNTVGLEYEAYLIETSFDLPLIKYSLYLAYKRLQMLSGDIYTNKAELYKQEYMILMDNLLFSYNNNLSNVVEIVENIRPKVTFRR